LLIKIIKNLSGNKKSTFSP